MENQFLDSRFLFPNPLTCLGDFLLKFSEKLPFPLVVKEKDTRKILSYNKASAKIFGLEKEGLEGLTSRDILSKVPRFGDLLDEEVKRIEASEQAAIEDTYQNTYLQTILIPNGSVLIRKMIITPMFGIRGQPIAIAIFCHDLTPHVNLLYLFELYFKKFYKDKKSQAVEQFSKYLKLESYFDSLLTCMETLTLLAMEKDARHKQVAYLLTHFRSKSISLITIANYINAIKSKLKPNIELPMVLSYLRGRGEWNLEHATY